MPKLTASQREQVKRWITVCKIRGLSVQATTDYVNQQLPNGYSFTKIGIQKYIAQIKIESKDWLKKMALDVYEFIDEIKERWDELHELKNHQWTMLDNVIKQDDIDGQIKAMSILLKTNVTILEIDMLLPQIAVPNSNASPSYPLRVGLVPEPEPLGPSPSRQQPEPTELTEEDKEPIL